MSIRSDTSHPVETTGGPPEQAALRRVATLVAEGTATAQLFAAVVDEVARVLGMSSVVLDRYEPDGGTTVLACSNVPGFPVGSHWPLDGPSLAATVLETGRAFRIDDYAGLDGTIGQAIRDGGFHASVGVPIVVDGGVWGILCIGAMEGESIPLDAEERLRDFTELIAIAISNAESREALRRLAAQQASLRRVATLVAQGATTGELFAAVAEEVAGILAVALVTVARYEPNGSAVVVGSLNYKEFPVGSRWTLDGPSLFAAVRDSGTSARIDDYSHLPGSVAAAARAAGLESGVGVPIVVDGRVWGAIVVGRRQRREALPTYGGSYSGRIVLGTESTREVERRLAAFTELVATAISRMQAHDDLRTLAEEQAALRRVATLVAEAAPPEEIFAAVAHEVSRLFGLQWVGIMRYEADDSFTVVATSGDHPFVAGSRWPLDGPSTFEMVYRTGRAARLVDYTGVPGTVAASARAAGIVGGIGAPIVVDGAIWGVIAAPSTTVDAIPEGAEVRLSLFTELVATAVSNASSRGELIASRARIVAAGDEARRRFERNLHDGTQQRLLALRLDLQRIRGGLEDDAAAVAAGLEDAERDIESVLEELRELSRGLHPSQLARGGLGPALRALAGRSSIPVEMEVRVVERPSLPIETAVYYIVSEALANATKHSRASRITVTVDERDGLLVADVVDDGVGGAVTGGGSGLVGLRDRVEALGGRFSLESPSGRGTTISIVLPLATVAS